LISLLDDLKLNCREKNVKKMFFSHGFLLQVNVLCARLKICTMSAITITRLYDLLSTKLGKETAENLTTFIENKINDELESSTRNLATKVDLAETREHLHIEISKSKVEIIKWMFVFWVGQLIAMFSFMLLFIKR
jgi:hypothetical protein